jgi:nitrate/TMAO reductase-like tetraheme cytochrome c subunit
MTDDIRDPESTPRAAPPIPNLYQNRVSWAGSIIASWAIANIAFLVLIGWISGSSNPYLGIFTWVVLPAFLVLGSLLFVLGIVREYRRRHREGYAGVPQFPRLDFNSPATRLKFTSSLIVGLFFIFLSAVGSYQVYEFSDSVTFCGTTCHTPMHPEFTAYQSSPHARVRCVECHVGGGASWYVKAKWNGAHQLYGVLTGRYPRPISTPVRNLRPANDTCEQCHWPERFIGAQMKVFTHFAADEPNTPRQVRMLLKTGGGSNASPLASGIHWHMNIANKITYIATDPQRQTIPWVRVEDRDGHVTEYKATSASLTPQQIADAPKRTMDCIDCHNRPAHIYLPPDRSLDLALTGGRIDRTLPGIKNIAATALTGKYQGTDEALRGIQREIEDAYRTKYPQVYNDRKDSIAHAIAETKAIFERTIFPEMQVDWRTHPNNIGHMYSPGCFRCHDGEHTAPDGRVVRKDCDICHTVLAQEQAAVNPLGLKGSPFQHPVDLGDMKAVTCTDCHTGGISP